MNINDYITINEAKDILGYAKESVTLLCRQGKLNGAKRIGHQWFIPRESVENYVKAPQGFAAIFNNDDHTDNKNSLISQKNNIEMEILRNLKIIVKEIRKLEKLVVQMKK